MQLFVVNSKDQKIRWLYVFAELLLCLCPLAARAQSSALWQTYMRAGIAAYREQRYEESEVLLQLALSEAEQQPKPESLVLITSCALRDVRAEASKNVAATGRCEEVSKIMAAPGPGLADVATALSDLSWHLNGVAKQKENTDKKDPKYNEELRQAAILEGEAENYSIFALTALARGSADKLTVMTKAAESAFLAYDRGDYSRSIELYDYAIERIEELAPKASLGDSSIVKPVVVESPVMLGSGDDSDKIDLPTLLILCGKAHRFRGIQEATKSQPDFAAAEQDFFDSELNIAKALRIWLETWPDHPYTLQSFNYLAYAYELRAELYEREKSPQRAEPVRAVASKLDNAVKQEEFDVRQALPLAAALLRLDDHGDRDSRIIVRAGELVSSGTAVSDALTQAGKELQIHAE